MSDLIIEDSYYEKMGSYFKKKGQHLESIGESYIYILRMMKRQGICSGETADALDLYIELAEKLKECSSKIGNNVSDMLGTYIATIDAKDQYIF